MLSKLFKSKKIAGHQLDFLPSALEIQQRPPAPLPRVMAWIIVLMITVFILWIMNGRVDIVSVAQGKIIPNGQIKTIQAFEKGVVKAILVSDGDSVKAGQAVIELDAQIAQSDLTRLETDVRKKNATLTRLNTLRSYISSGKQGVEGQSDKDLLQAQLLSSEWAEYRANRDLLTNTLVTRQAELRSLQAQIAKLQGTLPIITKRAKTIKGMVDKRLAAETDWLELEEIRITQQQDLLSQQAKADQIQSTINEVHTRHQLLASETASKLLQQMEELERQIASLNEEINKANRIYAQQIIYAPVDGVVQALGIHTVGAVVTPAQVLMHIVPEDVLLEVEAYLENKDIGFVQKDQIAEIKVNAFPFTEYGVIDAKVLQISDDAVADEQRGWIYKMRLLMDKNTMQLNERQVKLKPGMEVTAEIKTGTRYLVQYFLSPIVRYADESLEER